MPLLRRDSIPSHNSLVESQTRLRAVPVNELANRVIVGTSRAGPGQAVEDGRLGLFKIGELQDRFGNPLPLRFCISRQCNGRLRAVATASITSASPDHRPFPNNYPGIGAQSGLDERLALSSSVWNYSRSRDETFQAVAGKFARIAFPRFLGCATDQFVHCCRYL